MSSLRDVKMPVAQLVYGEIVYWVTILSALICMAGPVVALAAPENNLLNPHFLFASIFRGESPEGVWALSSTARAKLDVRTEKGTLPAISVEQALDALSGMPPPEAGADPAVLAFEGLTVTALAEEEGARLFAVEPGGRRLSLEEARQAVLSLYAREVFDDGHFWVAHPLHGDGFTELGLALGCSVALWALLATAAAYARERIYLYALLALWVSALVFLSAAGIISGGH